MPIDPPTLAWGTQESDRILEILNELKEVLGSSREEQKIPSRSQLDGSAGFIPTDQYENLVSEHYVTRVIRGPKGSGKSAFAAALVNDFKGLVKTYGEETGLAEILVIEAFPIIENSGADAELLNMINPLNDYFKQLRIDRIDINSIEESTKFIWQSFFYALQILSIEKYFAKTGNEESRLVFNRIKQDLSTQVVKLIDNDIAESRLAEAKSKKFIRDFVHGIGVPGVFPGVKVEDDVMQRIKLNLGSIARRLEDLMQVHRLQTWIVLDRVDDILKFETPAQIAAAGSLFAASTDHAATDSSLRLRLFLRGDLIDRIPKMGITIENSDVLLTSAISLRWSRVDLEWLVVNRLVQSKAFKSEILSGRSIAERKSRRNILTGLFPDKKYSNRYHTLQPYLNISSDSTYWEWLMRHVADGNLLYNPRYTLMALKFTVDAAIKNIKRGESRPVPANPQGSRVLFLPDDLEGAYQVLSSTALELVQNAFPELVSHQLINSLVNQDLWDSESKLRQYLKSLNPDVDDEAIQNFVETLDISGILFKDRRSTRCFVAPIFRFKISASAFQKSIRLENEDESAFPDDVSIAP